ncbi:unnamed protein product [Acanthoscelides obtectus]|uniref:Uncharacterized protein n=1 Tax=Acanthoscelides obtectus TaxID=200917 RepID=A0A9P0K972_ACAOB|nr:unnamed protein product [Acanthoscelides obtectus]CAK1645501.1 hypothetical protein AOBTE_LOCUS14130 [Acanthoscelides obtectus]
MENPQNSDGRTKSMDEIEHRYFNENATSLFIKNNELERNDELFLSYTANNLQLLSSIVIEKVFEFQIGYFGCFTIFISRKFVLLCDKRQRHRGY